MCCEQAVLSNLTAASDNSLRLIMMGHRSNIWHVCVKPGMILQKYIAKMSVRYKSTLTYCARYNPTILWLKVELVLYKTHSMGRNRYTNIIESLTTSETTDVAYFTYLEKYSIL